MTWRGLVTVGAVGAAGAVATLAIGAATGMPVGDVAAMATLLAVAVVASIGVTALAARLLARASFRLRMVAVALAGVLVGLVNLAAVALLMFVSSHDASLMLILLTYAGAVGVAASLGLARTQSAAIAELGAAAERLAAGDLDARVGSVEAGAEIRALASTLDQMAERLQRSIERERETEQRRRDLMTAVSHDLRTPLAGLRVMVEAIEDGVVEDPPTFRRYAAEMASQVGTLSALVDDLFELAQLDAGAIQAETRRARLAEVVDSALTAVESQVRAKGMLVETDLADLDETTCSPRLGRVLQNLIQNAVRHTPADGSVRVVAQRRPDGLEVAVADTGEGIPVESLDRVFDPFWRGDAARTTPGSGLGLALAKRIVEAMGGDISVESEPARGSRFSVLLPA